MSVTVDLPGNISVTSAVIDKIREGYSCVRDITDPVGSIGLAIPQDESKPSVWALGWFSKQYAAAQILFKVEDIELAISEDAQKKLCGKLVDFQGGKLVVRDRLADRPVK